MRSTKQVLSEAQVATRPLGEGVLEAILRGMLTMTEHGVLITDLDHRPLACNKRFGDIFRAEPERVPYMDVEELRGYVYPRLRDPEAWRTHLEEVYERPELTYADELELDEPPAITALRRTTGPLIDTSGNIVGRLWTFEDITAEKRRIRQREAVFEVSSFHSPDPAVVFRRVVDKVAELYDATAILSIRHEDRMEFREIARPPDWLGDVREIELKDTY